MKLNKKGITIIELIVSVALISVIMLFMYKLLADITFQKENDYFASVNQEQRIEIIDKIETTLASKTNIRSVIVASNNIYFKTSSGSMVNRIRVSNYNGENKIIYLYEGNSVVLNQWIIKGGTLDPNPTCEYKSAGGKVLYECTIEVYTANTNNQRYSHNGKSVNNNNTIDDIVFSVMY